MLKKTSDRSGASDSTIKLKTAVLFLVFNRLDTTRHVFSAIRQAKPPRLYLGADGPRANRPEEEQAVRVVRSYLLNHIDWKCEVRTLFREENLGCGQAVSGAITWFFENEEQGIILEDDCLPDATFFPFCEELLNKYKHEESVSSISGSNPIDYREAEESPADYFFSRYSRIWGWASWRRAWKDYDRHLSLWPECKRHNTYYDFFDSRKEAKRFAQNLEKCYNGEVDTWDFQWHFTKRMHRTLTLVSKQNLVQNIGGGENATHTSSSGGTLLDFPVRSIEFPLTHPPRIVVDEGRDRYLSKARLRSAGLFTRVRNLLKRLPHKVWATSKQ